MKNSSLSLLGIIIMLGGFGLNFSLAAYTNMDFWAGAAFILMPILVGGCVLMAAIISSPDNEHTKKESMK